MRTSCDSQKCRPLSHRSDSYGIQGQYLIVTESKTNFRAILRNVHRSRTSKVQPEKATIDAGIGDVCMFTVGRESQPCSIDQSAEGTIFFSGHVPLG
jgi:hypothetical protein